MWTSETFAAIEQLLDYLNAHRIRPEHCKIITIEGRRGAPSFHLLMQTEGDAGQTVLAVAEGEAESPATPERGEVVDEAEAIILDAQRDE